MENQEFKKTVQAGIKAAMISKDTIRLETLRSINNTMMNFEKALVPVEYTDISLIATMIKQRNQSIEGFTKGGNIEAAENEKKEIEILKEFLPKQLSDDEIVKIVTGMLETEFKDMEVKDQGKVIAAFKERNPGQNMAPVVSTIKTFLANK
jgi:uncharacterized protein YqeY